MQQEIFDWYVIGCGVVRGFGVVVGYFGIVICVVDGDWILVQVMGDVIDDMFDFQNVLWFVEFLIGCG